MTAAKFLYCDAPFCNAMVESRLPTLLEVRRWAKRHGWTKARTNNRDADYCPEHANYRTKQ